MSELSELADFAEMQRQETDCLHNGALDWEVFDEEEGPLGCQDCGTMFNYKTCKKCGKEVIRFGVLFDDCSADASVTSSGDLMCCRCAKQYEEDEEEDWDGTESWEYA